MKDIRVAKPQLDGIVFVLPFSICKTDLKRIRRRVDKLVEECLCEIALVRGSRYHVRFRIELPGGHKVLVQIGAFDVKRKHGDVRIELNPTRLEPGDLQHFRTILRRVLRVDKDEFRRLFAAALINRLHVAVDIHGADLNRLLVHCQHVNKLSMFGKRIDSRMGIEGYNFGALGSHYQTAVYDKNLEQAHRAVEAIARAGRIGREDLKDIKIKQLFDTKFDEPRTRVEVRGQKMNGVAPRDIASITNRFARIKFADLDEAGSDLPPLTRQAFISMCRDIGVKSALAAFKGAKRRRQVQAFWDSHQASWWQPQLLWQQAAQRLRESGLFPPETFEPER